MKKTTIAILIVLITFCLAITTSTAADKKKIAPTKIAPSKVTDIGKMVVKLPPRADLKVDVIHAYRCACDLDGVDAFYMSNIMVDLSNGSGVATTSTLTVTYYDVLAGPQTVSKSISSLNPYPTNPWALQRFVVVSHPVLVKKSVGIKAEIKPTSPTTDSNPANNIKVVKRCDVMVY